MRGIYGRAAAGIASLVLLAGMAAPSLAHQQHEHGTRPWLGVVLGDHDDGARVLSVMEGSPAADAGLQTDDIIVSLNGRDVTGAGALVEGLQELEPGDSPDMTVLRDGRRMDLRPVLEKRGQGTFEMPRFNFNFQGLDRLRAAGHRRGHLGVHLQPLSAELQEHFGAPRGQGILVSRVEPDSPAQRGGLQVGDVITGIDGSEVAGQGDLIRVLTDREEGDSVEITAYRDGRALTFPVEVEIRESSGFNFSFRCDDDEESSPCRGFRHFNGGEMDGVFRMLQDSGWQEELREQLDGMKKHLREFRPEASTGSGRERLDGRKKRLRESRPQASTGSDRT